MSLPRKSPLRRKNRAFQADLNSVEPGCRTMMRLLFIRLRSLGDTVLMTPALTAARAAGVGRIAVVVEAPFHEVLQGNSDIDRLIVVDNRLNRLVARWRAVLAIRRFSPDVAIDMHGGTTSALLTALSGAGRRVGFARSRNTRHYTVRVPDPSSLWPGQSLHTVHDQLSALKFLGFPVNSVPPLKIGVDASAVHAIRNQLRDRGVEPGFVLIHPAAAFETKQWAAANFAEIASALAGEQRSVVVTAGPGQESLIREIQEICPPSVVFLEPMRLAYFAALCSLCGLYVGNDTGPTHIASALGKKIVAIFGSSNVRAWRPWGVENRVVKSDLACIPCPGYRCLEYDEPVCIRSIPVSSVLDAIRELL